MFKRILAIIGILALIIGGWWLVAGPETVARISYMTYRTPYYRYTVQLATYAQEGIRVSIEPERPGKDSSEFADTYLQASRERAQQWIADHRTGLMDVMVLFSRPLTLEEANRVLRAANAQVFESGVVGYEDGIPFASYSKEKGPFLTASLQEHAEMIGDSMSVDVRGYLAVRAWVNRQGLAVLLQHEDVQVVDTTPQDVRDRLAQDRHWRDKPIDSLAIEMPVWAGEW